MPTCVSHVAEEHFFFVRGTLTYLALGILGGGAAMGVGEGKYGPFLSIFHSLSWVANTQLTLSPFLTTSNQVFFFCAKKTN